MSTEYQNNHYVPEWYQKRFLLPGQKEQALFYLDFQPGFSVDAKGGVRPNQAIRRKGPRHCFAEKDLYTTAFGNEESKNIEKYFFGQIDFDGKRAVEFIANFAHPSFDGKAFENLLMYMSTQKLRTIKGLEWLTILTLRKIVPQLSEERFQLLLQM
jgi:hypothetical protein